MKEVRGEVKTFKAELRDQVDASQNPAVNLVSQGVDKVFSETGQALAVKEMKKYDPEFDLEELLFEAEEIFQEFYCNYLTGNIEYLNLICGYTAGAYVQATIEGRKKEGWTYKYDEVLTCGPTFFMGAKIEEKAPTFTFTVEVQEFETREYHGKIPENAPPNETGIMQNTYMMVLRRHDEPEIEITGHYWEIVEFAKVGT